MPQRKKRVINDEEQAFFRAMEANDEDDTPRLVYADWLEERGQADRAKFIRLQIQAAQITSTNRLGAQAIEEETRKLWQRNRVEWTTGYPEWVKSRCSFKRGFPEFRLVSGRRFLNDAARIRTLMPMSVVGFDLLEGVAPEVFASEHFAALQSISLDHSCNLTDADLEAFSQSPNIGQLRSLSLNMSKWVRPNEGNRLTDATILALASSPYLLRLQTLILTLRADVEYPALRTLLHSPQFAGLQSLSLACNPHGDEIAMALHSPNCSMRKLRELSLHALQLTDAGLAALAASPHLSSLVKLGLYGSKLTDDSAAILCTNPTFQQLHTLQLHGNPSITDEGKRQLTANRKWETLWLDKS